MINTDSSFVLNSENGAYLHNDLSELNKFKSDRARDMKIIRLEHQVSQLLNKIAELERKINEVATNS